MALPLLFVVTLVFSSTLAHDSVYLEDATAYVDKLFIYQLNSTLIDSADKVCAPRAEKARQSTSIHCSLSLELFSQTRSSRR